MANDHFVTRALSEPWEFGQRRLWFYDFNTKAFDEQSSKTLFAAEGLNPPDVEKRLGAIVESPLTKFRADYLAKKTPPDGEIPWPVYRALAVVFMTQAFRSPNSKRPHLDELMRDSDTVLDQMVNAFMEDQMIMIQNIPPHLWVGYPYWGMFQVPFAEQRNSWISGVDLGYALPLTPNLVLTLLPKVSNIQAVADHVHFFTTYSVRVNENSPRVVLPPALRAYPEPELAEELERLRKAAVDGLLLVARIRELLAQQKREITRAIVPKPGT